MLAIEQFWSDGCPSVQMPLWAVTGERPERAGCISRIRLNVAAPSRLAAVAVVRRDDPFWNDATIRVEQHPDEQCVAPTRGGILMDWHLSWRFANGD